MTEPNSIEPNSSGPNSTGPNPDAPSLTGTHPAPAPTVWPAFRARDARALIRFLVDAFGFEETAVFGEGDVVQHAQLSWPLGGGIMLGSVRPDGADEKRASGEGAWAVRPGGTGTYVVVADDAAVDALHARAAAAGAEVLQAPEDQDYGSREFTARDPEGNLWSFGSYRGEPRTG